MQTAGERVNGFSHILMTSKKLRPTDLKNSGKYSLIKKDHTELLLIILYCISENCKRVDLKSFLYKKQFVNMLTKL